MGSYHIPHRPVFLNVLVTMTMKIENFFFQILPALLQEVKIIESQQQQQHGIGTTSWVHRG